MITVTQKSAIHGLASWHCFSLTGSRLENVRKIRAFTLQNKKSELVIRTKKELKKKVATIQITKLKHIF